LCDIIRLGKLVSFFVAVVLYILSLGPEMLNLSRISWVPLGRWGIF